MDLAGILRGISTVSPKVCTYCIWIISYVFGRYLSLYVQQGLVANPNNFQTMKKNASVKSHRFISIIYSLSQKILVEPSCNFRLSDLFGKGKPILGEA